MAWEEFGAADGRPVLFLHGTPGGRLSAAKYEPFALARGLRLVAPDRPGYGLSTARPGMTLSDYAEALLDLCWWRGWGPVPVVAGSAGAAYALALGAAASEMVTGVSIFSGIAPMTDDEARTLIPVNQQLRCAVDDPAELQRLVGQVRDAILAGRLKGLPEDPALTDALKPGADGMVADYLNVCSASGVSTPSRCACRCSGSTGPPTSTPRSRRPDDWSHSCPRRGSRRSAEGCTPRRPRPWTGCLTRPPDPHGFRHC